MASAAAVAVARLCVSPGRQRLPGAGFTSGDPWIAVNPNHRWLNAAAQYDDPASVFSWYRRLIELRHTSPLVVDGRFAHLAPDDPQLFAYTRTLGAEQLLVLAR